VDEPIAEALPRLTQDSRRHRVAQVLRQEIIAGRLRPGDRLREVDLAEQLGTSRAPVREALRQLEQEGLVVSYPYRGTEVLGVSVEEVHEVLIPIRLTLERFAIRHALPAATDRLFDELAAQVRHMQRAARYGDLDDLTAADVRFHEAIIAASDHEHSKQLWQLIQPRVWAYFRRDASRHTSTQDVVDQHTRLLDALRTRDVDAALLAIEEHLADVPSGRSSPEGP
jgi:DNA-binding GntR family transcriptional regulator